MAFREIIAYGHPTLHHPGEVVRVFDGELHKLADEMFDAMYGAEGVGLAAPQVNVPLQFVVMSVPREHEERLHMVMANPRIVETRGQWEFEEGCLSVPEIRDMVTRPEWIRVEYQDMDGNPQSLEADGLFARVIQHEIDHINGVLFVDRLTPARRIRWESALKKLAKESTST
ncbi:MAG: peptide deformylase [bacterium]